jgi:uronate dehydrogenase
MSILPSRVLVTGAAGNVGSALRAVWPRGLESVTFTDIRPAPPVRSGERFVVADLADRAAVDGLVAGMDAIVHMGGISKERGWDEIRSGNIEGTYNLYEAARKAGVRRVVYASSLHVTGFHGVDEVLTPDTAPRPSTLYGVSKAFGEALARLYWDKFGIEGLVIRIGTFAPKPNSARALRTWMSPRDLISLVERALSIEHLGFEQVYGVSANSRSWWRNPDSILGGWQPQDSADDYQDEIGDDRLDPALPEGRYQGAGFAAIGHFDDGPPADARLAPVFGLRAAPPDDPEKT